MQSNPYRPDGLFCRPPEPRKLPKKAELLSSRHLVSFGGARSAEIKYNDRGKG